MTGGDPVFADASLARRLAADDDWASFECATALRLEAPDAEIASLEVGGGHAVYAGAGSPLSQAKGLGMAGAVSPEDLDRLDEFYRSRGCPAQVTVCPFADASLREVSRRGYRLLEFENFLVRRMDAAPARRTPPAGITIRVIEPSERDLWSRVCSRGFFGDDSAAEPFLPMFRAMGRLDYVTLYLALAGDMPAGAAGFGVRDGLGGMFGTSVLPEFRGRGTHRALIEARLAHARASGCDLVWVGTQPGSGSQRNFERLSFRLAYTQATMIREWS